MNDNKIGYNPEEIKELGRRLAKTRSYIQEFVSERFSKVVFGPLGEAWKAPEAETYSAGIDGVWQKLKDNIEHYYEGLIDFIKGIVVRWIEVSELPKIEYIFYETNRDLYEFDGVEIFRCDAADSNGNVYLDPDMMREIIKNVNNLEMEFQTTLSNYRNNLNLLTRNNLYQ